MLMLTLQYSMADDVVLYWADGLTGANSINVAGFTLQITGNTSKSWAAGNGSITIGETSYMTIKNSNGAKNTVTCPNGIKAKKVTFYAVTNDNSTKGRLSEFNNEECTDEVSSLKDYEHPTVIEKTLTNPAESFTFTFSTKQVCFVIVVEVAYTATFENTGNWTDVYAYTFTKDANNQVTDQQLGNWPGTKLEADATGKYPITVLGSLPQYIIFNNNSDSQTADLIFKKGGEYNADGRIITYTSYSASFTTEAEWEHVYAYCWNNTEGEKALGEWPGTEITASLNNGVYSVNLDAEYLPEGILFHNNNGLQTPDYEFADGATFTYNKSTYTVTFTTDAEWGSVYAWAWSGSGNNIVNHCATWPGTLLEANASGVYTFKYNTFGDMPEKILFNGGDDTKKTIDLTFKDGKAYKWITATPLYALSEGATFTAGTTVDVKDADEDVVATITYGVEGGNAFTAAIGNEPNEDYEGFAYMTAGNGQNGSADGGTVYTIKPLYDGTITVGVKLNANKNFYIQEDGTSMTGYNGITIDQVARTSYSFPVKAGSVYKVFCTGSKLGFYGFDYKFNKIVDYYVIADNGTKWVALGKMTYYAPMGEYDYTLDKTWTGKYFAIAPASALNSDGDVVDWSKVVRPVTETGNWLVELRQYHGGVVINPSDESDKVVWEKSDEITNMDVVYYINQGKFALYPESEVTISSAGYATYSNEYAYQIHGAGVEVSIVTAVTTEAVMTNLTLYTDDGGTHKEYNIPAGTGVIVKGTGSFWALPFSTNAFEEYVDVTGNMLIGSGNTEYVITGKYNDTDEYRAFILADGANGVGFYILDGNDNELAAHKAFLAVPKNGGSDAPNFIGFGDTTGIDATLNDNGQMINDNVIYDLSGRRVMNPTKGLYIINGKKVVIK